MADRCFGTVDNPLCVDGTILRLERFLLEDIRHRDRFCDLHGWHLSCWRACAVSQTRSNALYFHTVALKKRVGRDAISVWDTDEV
jgi:hypothetical protein